MKPKRILLAEDDADDRELFQEAMSVVAPEIKVTMVENGEKLIAFLNESDDFPDCIFLDLNMPKKNGKDCLAEIKKNNKTMRIPIVIYSTSMTKKDVDETFDNGAACFIRKPNSFRELIFLLNKYITTSAIRAGTNPVKHRFVLNS
jgi:CheY-like chemotaxis protein